MIVREVKKKDIRDEDGQNGKDGEDGDDEEDEGRPEETVQQTQGRPPPCKGSLSSIQRHLFRTIHVATGAGWLFLSATVAITLFSINNVIRGLKKLDGLQYHLRKASPRGGITNYGWRCGGDGRGDRATSQRDYQKHAPVRQKAAAVQSVTPSCERLGMRHAAM